MRCALDHRQTDRRLRPPVPYSGCGSAFCRAGVCWCRGGPLIPSSDPRHYPLAKHFLVAWWVCSPATVPFTGTMRGPLLMMTALHGQFISISHVISGQLHQHHASSRRSPDAQFSSSCIFYFHLHRKPWSGHCPWDIPHPSFRTAMMGMIYHVWAFRACSGKAQ